MARKRTREEGPKLFDETQQLISLLSSDSRQETVILAIPSHDRRNRALGDGLMGEWAQAGMKLFADLYGGATAFRTYKGVFKTDEGQYLWDEPILIESYAMETDIADVNKLNELDRLCKAIGS